MTYKYTLPSRAKGKLPAKKPIPVVKEGPALSGVLKGKTASDLEEVFGIALDNNPRVQWWEFRKNYGAPRGQVGAIELDFLVSTGTLYLFQIDGDWIHRTAEARAHDLVQDMRLNEMMKTKGARPVVRVQGSRLQDGLVASQEKANRLVEDLIS